MEMGGAGGWLGFLCEYLAAGTSGGSQHSAFILFLSLSPWLGTDFADLASPLCFGLAWVDAVIPVSGLFSSFTFF